MRCNNCGNENAVGAAFCINCGSSIGNSPAGASSAPAEQGAPPYPPQLYQPPRSPTVRSIHLGQVLFLISSALLLVAGFENFASLSFGARASYVLLGMFAIVGGLLFLGMVVMPYVLKPVEQYLDVIVLGLSAVFLFWGVAAMFGSGIGSDGGHVFIGGLFGLAGMGLKMGIIR